HAARRAHVRVPRSADQRGDAAYPRLSWRLATRLRRPRQLQPRRARADHLSGDPVRRHRPGARHGYHHHDDGARQQGRPRAARGLQLSVPQVVAASGLGSRTLMAKTNMIEREKRRGRVSKKNATKRAQLKEIIRAPNSTSEQRLAAQIALAAQPRDASVSRQRKRCAITGRPRGVYRKFGLSRVKIREVAMRGEIPGLGKASW